MDKEKKLLDEYGFLQWHKIKLKELIKDADNRQDEIKKELKNLE